MCHYWYNLNSESSHMASSSQVHELFKTELEIRTCATGSAHLQCQLEMSKVNEHHLNFKPGPNSEI